VESVLLVESLSHGNPAFTLSLAGERLPGALGTTQARYGTAEAARAEASRWDQRYQEGSDGWELGQPAPPLAQFLRSYPLAPQAPGRVLVPGCGRGHEVVLLADLGFGAIGLDFRGEA
jgi:thiopurine S-methyltransferase